VGQTEPVEWSPEAMLCWRKEPNYTRIGLDWQLQENDMAPAGAGLDLAWTWPVHKEGPTAT